MKSLSQILTYTAITTVSLLLNSCGKYFDQVPDDRITIEEVFQKKYASEQYLANVYNYVKDQSNQWSDNPWVGNCDEMEVAWAKYNVFRLNIGSWTPTNGYFDTWVNHYQGIRSATYFMKHIGGNAEILRLDGRQKIDQYRAEARFVRAYLYFSILRQYGPAVIIGDDELPFDATDAALQLPRNSFEECTEYVAAELDSAAAVLPVDATEDRDWGRATKGAALALKSRLLLYAASPLYNGNTEYASFKNADGKQLISQTFNREKWKAAADAAKAVIDMGRYSLYTASNGDPITSYRNIFFENWNNEIIFSRKSNGLTDWDVHCSPRAAGGWCGLGVTQEMVDAYLMKDGLPVNKSPLYSESGFTDGIFNMYVNREPRFYASVLFHGKRFKGGNITNEREINFFKNGADGKYEGTEDFTHTGYLVYKNVSPNTNRISGQWDNRPYIYFRLGEIYLNYAEALNEYDYNANLTETLKYLNLIRNRAGIPRYGEGENALPIPANQEEMRTAIRSERRIELAFETHRWFDIRRWKQARTVMSSNIHGMNVNGSNAEEFFKRTDDGPRVWRDAYVWFPIPQWEIDRSKMVVQNPGW
jgi:hypothetical protein